MRKASSSPAPVPSSKASSSAWAKGPPTQSSTPLPTSPALSAPPSSAATPQANGNQHAVANPAPASGHSRKSSIMAIGGEAPGTKNIDLRSSRGNPQPISFGSLDSPNTALSSSPAAPSVTGSHLDANAVKSFGTIEADASAAAQRANTGAAVPTGIKKPLDMHALFGANATGASPAGDTGPDSRPSGSTQQVQTPQTATQPNQSANSTSSAQHLRAPTTGPQPRSPTMSNQMPQPQAFRPIHTAPNRMNGQPAHGMPSARGPGLPSAPGQYGMHPGHAQQYPGMGGYQGQSGYYFNYETQNQYGVPPQWAGQQSPGHFAHPGQSPYPQMAMSPRGGQQPLAHGSPSPHNAGLPGSGGPSSSPTPPSRPQSMAGQLQSASPMANAASPNAPSTPARPHSFQAPSSPFTPHTHPVHLQGQVLQSPATLAALSASASSFTPRRSGTAIKISRPDGTAFDLGEAARAVKATATTPTPSAASPAVTQSKPEGKKPSFSPVVVRLESEEQKKIRLAEEAKEKKMKELEKQEEQDRKERRARLEAEKTQAQAKVEAEKVEKEREDADAAAEKDKAAAAAKEEADAQAEADRDAQAKQEAQKKEQEDIAAQARATEAQVDAKKAESAAAQAELESSIKSEADASARTHQEAENALALSSPAPTAAGLPPKPIVDTSRKPTPAALSLGSEADAADAPPSASTAALGSAKNIENLQSISYPSNLKSPSSALNETSEPGKFRYDRDFLLQFMDICREKPESLPALDAIGLEADTSSNFGSSRGGSRTGRPSMGPPSGRGGGMGGGRGGFPMGNFGMGSFGQGQIGGRPSTSEERLAQSRIPPGNQRPSGSGMIRTSSQGGPSQQSPHLHNRGGPRSQRGTKRMPNDTRMSYNPMEPEVAPLVVTGDAWSGQRRRVVDENSPEFIERKVKSLLNKLTQEKFDSISVQILEWANKSKDEEDGRTLRLVIKLIFEKATDEAHWSSMYARLCRMLLDRISDEVSDTFDGKRISGGPLFRKYLLGRCQVDFETGWKSREDAASAALATSEDDKARLAAKAAAEGKGEGEKSETEEEGKQPEEAAMLSDEYYIAQKAKRRGLGLVQLIGELFKMEMLSRSVIVTCMVKLLSNVNDPDEEDIESICKLLTTVGAVMERQHPSALDIFFDRLRELSKSPNINSRMRFMVLDVIELRSNKWQLRNSDGGVQTIAQVHEQAAREQAKKTAQAAQSSREASSRSGSRQGHPRRNEFGGGGQGGSDWTPVANARLPQRQTDFSSFGRIGTQTGVPTALGPSSVFNKRKSTVPGQVTPPLSRQSSSSNMFGVLSGDGSAEAGPSEERRGSSDGGSQRKRIALLPRSKPVESEDGEGKDGDEDDADEESEDDAASEGEEEEDESSDMSESAARVKITSDMKELWGEKDAGGSRNPDDILEYFRALPAAHQKSLATQLVDDVFRIAKTSDAEVVAKGWSKAAAEGVTTAEILQSSLMTRMEALDDDSIDFPLAYTAVAVLIRGAGLDDDGIAALGDAIAVDGTPRLTPKDKLARAFATLDSA